MMTRTTKSKDAAFKAILALEAVKGIILPKNCPPYLVDDTLYGLTGKEASMYIDYIRCKFCGQVVVMLKFPDDPLYMKIKCPSCKRIGVIDRWEKEREGIKIISQIENKDRIIGGAY